MNTCKYCGSQFASIAQLTAATCYRHPLGGHRGAHVLYEGSAKASYACKHCGTRAPAIAALVAASCFRHPSGPHKGKHEPALIS
jgi:DNA-directed RNA polymerase subunit RPC12/RpoP